ncbi:hypothetical protein ACSFA8_17085 [Variovorax sp. RT4R15]|uniref:hypothetical protein n=1 Tax=Variovorax sp. RT4R15 TaxID=3443737 RepID=UPI003F46121E
MSATPHPTKQQLLLGVAQAALFLGGALLGRWLGLMLGLDALGAGYGNNTIFGILLIGIGGGAGVQIARALYKRKYGDPRS